MRTRIHRATCISGEVADNEKEEEVKGGGPNSGSKRNCSYIRSPTRLLAPGRAIHKNGGRRSGPKTSIIYCTEA